MIDPNDPPPLAAPMSVKKQRIFFGKYTYCMTACDEWESITTCVQLNIHVCTYIVQNRVNIYEMTN